ncbi:MAG: MotA/TolQ/ExbB proton channel family protein [Myxococcota bacterium]
MLDWFMKGGPVMYPIALCSVVALAAFFERLWGLRREKVVPQAFCVEIVELVRQQRYPDALTLCRKRDASVARILEVAIELRAHDRAAIKERVEEVGRREAHDLEQYLAVVGTVGSLGPLLGLLGTVSGMIVTFESIEVGGMGQMSLVAGGIGQALITTFGGLVVAIPAVVAHRYLLSKVDRLVIELEEVSLGVVDLLVEPVRAETEGRS